MKSVIIGENEAGQRVDKFLQKSFKMPASLMYKYFRKKRIKLNGKKCEGNVMLSIGDKLELYINDELLETEEKSAGTNTDIDIVYEDENIIIMDKPAGLLCHGEGQEDSLVRRMTAYLIKKGEYIPEKELSFSPALCNRLDRNTAGLLIGAKNAQALREINKKIREDKIKKYYMCLVWGQPKAKSGVLESNLTKDERINKVSLSDKATNGSRMVRTGYKVLKSNGNMSLLEVELFTGRPHQIRAQLAALGHPLVGDNKYGDKEKNKKTRFEYQALYSYKLIFQSVKSGEKTENLCGKTFLSEKVYFKDFI